MIVSCPRYLTLLLIAACTGAEPDSPPRADNHPAVTEPTGVAEVAPEPEPPPPQSSDRWTAGITIVEYEVTGSALQTDIRAAENDGFDRVVLEFAGEQLPSYHVEYVDRPIRQCGSGETVEIAGDGWLSVRVEPANAHTEAGEATIQDRSRRLALPLLRELTLICDFEAQVEWILGVESPNRYRVLELADPARLIIDVRH